MRSRAALELLHPPLRHPSGGNGYDRCLLDAASRRGFPLSSLVVHDDEVEACLRERTPSLRIWDGLLLEHAARRGRLARGRRAVLLHWLPSLDPELDAIERGQREAIERAIVDSAVLVIVPGESMQRTLRRRHPRQAIERCEPGLRPAFLAPRRARGDAARPVVELLTVSNLVPAKGLVELLPILASLHTLSWRWHLVGDGDADPACARRFDETVQGLGLAQRVVRHGALDASGVAQRMDQADVFVFPSRLESYGIALAEAAARALPTVAFRVGDAERLFTDERDALLVRVGDHAAFARALRRAIDDAALRARFRARLADRAPPRDWDHALDAFAHAVRRHSSA